MRTNRPFRGMMVGLIGAVAFSAALDSAEACTRVLYVAKDGTVMVGRSMDRGEELLSNMWALRQRIKREQISTSP